MESKIIFLGTAGDNYVISRQFRASGGILLQIGDYQFLIDPGPGSLVRASEYDINYRENTAVIATSADIKHCNDINIVADAMTHEGLDVKGVLVSNEDVVNGTDSIPPYLTPKHKKFFEKVIIAQPLQKIGIENIELLALPTRSKSPHTFGLKVFTQDFCLVYTSDTALSKDVAKHYRGADILIVNCLLPSQIKSKYNLCSADTIKILKAIKPKLALITHFGKKMLEADPLLEARHIQRESSIQTLAAQDGLSIDPVSYSAKSKQKTLSSFD